MRFSFLLYLIVFFIPGKCISNFRKRDLDLVFSLAQPLEISFCVFVKRSDQINSQILNISKNFSKKNLYFNYFTFNDFLPYFSKGKIPQWRSMIVLKADNNSEVFGMAEEPTRKVSSKIFFHNNHQLRCHLFRTPSKNIVLGSSGSCFSQKT